MERELIGLDALFLAALLDQSSWVFLEKCRIDPADQISAQMVAVLSLDACKHANCTRSFIRTYRSDRALAQQYAEKAMQYLESKS